MPNFTKSAYSFNGTNYVRYTADRKRGGASWVFYSNTPANTTYSPTWPEAVDQDATLALCAFISRIEEDFIHVDFLTDLSGAQETALETLYTNHVAPVPV